MPHPDDPAERLAAIAHAFVSGQREALDAALSAAAKLGDELPRLAALLASPKFAELKRLLDERGVDVEQLQRMIDELVRRGAVPSSNSPLERHLQPLVAAAAAGKDVDALLEQLRAELLEQQPERAGELDDFIAQLRDKLAAFTGGAR